MGTRADFYVGRGEDAEWLGSIGWDGYPDGIPSEILEAVTADVFKEAVRAFLVDRDDGTTPEMGWPWPWDTSDTTDYAYAFDGQMVHASCFGCNWFDPSTAMGDDRERIESDVPTRFPDMSPRKRGSHDIRSGVIFIS